MIKLEITITQIGKFLNIERTIIYVGTVAEREKEAASGLLKLFGSFTRDHEIATASSERFIMEAPDDPNTKEMEK